MSDLLVIYAPSKEAVTNIIGKLPARLNSQYTILVMKPGMEVEGIDDLTARLVKTAEEMIAKHKKKVFSYVN